MAPPKKTSAPRKVRLGNERTVEHDYQPGVVYLVRDTELRVECLFELPPSQDKVFFKDPGNKCQDGTWMPITLAPHFSRNRAPGLWIVEVPGCKGAELRFYVVPEKLLNLSDLATIVADIEGEFGLNVLWDPRSASTVRAGVVSEASGSRRGPLMLLERVEDELKAARSLRRHPILEFGMSTARLVPAPEMALVSRWALRRGTQLGHHADNLADTIIRYERLTSEKSSISGTESRAKSLKLHVDANSAARRVRAEVLAMVDPEELHAPPIGGPLLQRDHRLRKLATALGPTLGERICEQWATLSSLPPVTLNRLFELWGAIWMARRLRTLGFDGAGSFLGGAQVEAAAWRLRQGDIQIHLDFEAHPAPIDGANLPMAHERDETAAAWAARHQRVDADRPFLASDTARSPDYLLRIAGPNGKVLAVGDATLADPDWHEKGHAGNKADKVARYAQTIFWVDKGQPRFCHPMGEFVMLPGPSSTWKPSALDDVTLICPRPHAGDMEAEQRFDRMIHRLIAAVR